MKILIPMAGHSRRFFEAGFKDPKQFIYIDGKPMIQRVCEMFSPKDEFIFIANKEQLKNKKYLDILKNVTKDYQIVEIDPHDEGPLYTTLQAKHLMKENEPLIISYCDFFCQWNYQRFLQKATMYEGAMSVFKGFHPASFGNTNYCYIKTNPDREMIALQEKQPFTNNRSEEYASTGVYYLESWHMFEYYANLIINQGKRVATEFYVSLIYNPIVESGKKVCTFEVEKFICWGTPQDLKEYLFWSEYFAMRLVAF